MAGIDHPVLLIGEGRLGGAIVQGWRSSGALDPDQIWVRRRHVSPDQATDGACCHAPVVVVAVKPPALVEVGAAYDDLLSPSALIVSVAAGVRAAAVSAMFGGRTVARVMPTTAVVIGRGTASVYAADAAARGTADALFAPIATVVHLQDEALLDAATAVSGSGPAYLYAFVEALAAAGEAAGLSGEDAARLARSTIAGAAALLEQSGETPEALRRQVTSPGGTTQAALDVLEPALAPLMQEAVRAAVERARQLGG